MANRDYDRTLSPAKQSHRDYCATRSISRITRSGINPKVVVELELGDMMEETVREMMPQEALAALLPPYLR